MRVCALRGAAHSHRTSGDVERKKTANKKKCPWKEFPSMYTFRWQEILNGKAFATDEMLFSLLFHLRVYVIAVEKA